MKKIKKLLAITLAVAMVMGMSVASFADEGGEGGECQHTNMHQAADVDNHFDVCDNCQEIFNRTSHNLASYCDGHVLKCNGCSYMRSEGAHTMGWHWVTYPDGTQGHRRGCNYCEYGEGEVEAHDTNGVAGSCSVCGFGKPCSSSEETHEEPAQKPAEEAAPAAPAMTVAEAEAKAIEAATKAIEAVVSAEEAIPVASFTSASAVNAIPAEVKVGNDTTFNISAVTTTQGFVAAVNKVANASSAPSLSVYSAEPIAMNASALNAIAKTGKTFIYTFTYNGHIYKVTIPAGTQVNTNGQMFMGPLAIGAQLGTTEILK